MSFPGVDPDTITHEDIDFETFSMEELDDELPCDVSHKRCKSHHTEPATWLGSHKQAEPGCTILLCEPCVIAIQDWIAHMCVAHGLNGFGCRVCGRSYMNYKEIITRHL